LGYHAIAVAAVGLFAHWLVTRVQPLPPTSFDRNQVISYQPTEYLPPINTLRWDSEKPQTADQVAAKQPIISVPAEADNRRQTIVSAPNVRLKRDVALPNMVVWREKLDLPIAPAPLVPAASLSRLTPDMDNSVVAPPPDAQRMARRRDLPQMQTSVVAPPPDITASASKVFQSPQAAVIEPPPNVQAVSTRAGDINIARASVIEPAPQLALASQHASRGSGPRAVTQVGAPQVIPPPPSLSSSTGSSKSRSGGSATGKQFVALSLNPAVGAPPEPPAGNRRGTFTASVEGKAGASGTPGSASGTGKSAAKGSGGEKNNLPSGLYVGTPAKPATSVVAGDPSANKVRDTVNPNLLAGVRPPRITAPSAHTLQPGDVSRLSEAERQVFGDRKFYSLTLNMPNLNSAGGSWVIRFAELQKNGNAQVTSLLSAPAAVRKVDPAYPMQLMRENVAGTVIVYGVIHADGSVGNVRVLRSVDDRIDQFASQAVAQWKFDPATKNGTPVEVEATFQIPFHPAHVF
jgi:TonB family protein